MDINQISNIAIKNEGVYYINKGIVAGVIYSKEQKRIWRIFTKGDFLGIDKYIYDMGLVDYYAIGEISTDFIKDSQLKKGIENKVFAEHFHHFLSEMFTELISFSRETYSMVLYYNMLKLLNASNGKIKGLPKYIIDEFHLQDEILELTRDGKVYYEDELYQPLKF